MVLYGSIVLLVMLRPWSSLARSRVAPVVAWALVLLLTVAVGYARVYRGMHHLSDVVTGAVMGLGALAVAVTATRASSLADHRTVTDDGPRMPRATAPDGSDASSGRPSSEEVPA